MPRERINSSRCWTKSQRTRKSCTKNGIELNGGFWLPFLQRRWQSHLQRELNEVGEENGWAAMRKWNTACVV